MSSALEALKKKREDLKAKLMRRKEKAAIGVGATGESEVSSSLIPPVSVSSQSVSSSTGIKQEDVSAPIPIPKKPQLGGSQGLSDVPESRKRKREECDTEQGGSSAVKQSSNKSEKEEEVIDLTLENLLTSTSFKEQESKEMGQEIHDLLSMPTAKEKSIKEAFKSKGG